jgi:hypothetical protein
MAIVYGDVSLGWVARWGDPLGEGARIPQIRLRRECATTRAGGVHPRRRSVRGERTPWPQPVSGGGCTRVMSHLTIAGRSLIIGQLGTRASHPYALPVVGAAGSGR